MTKQLTGLARKLRIQSTDTEQLLWRNLRSKSLNSYKFRRQQPIGDYIVDFVCFEKMIIIELDGGQHSQEEQIKKDQERDKWLESEGFEVLRFWDNDVLNNTKNVIEVILDRCLNHPPLNPLPSREGIKL
jgi:very-short-patch-repair endonuclease